MILTFKITEEITVKEFLKVKITNNLLKEINKEPQYFVNNQSVLNYYLMQDGDTLEVVIPVTKTQVLASKGDIDILYEDSYLLILNKPHDLASIPTRMHYTTSLANYVLYYYIKKGINAGIHFVNRLDYATSGIIVVAKDAYIADKMKTMIIEKKYLLKIHGNLKEDGSISTTIKKDPNSIIKRMNVEGEEAVTSYHILDTSKDEQLIEATLHTGKTHQLRLHFSYLKHPIIGDKLYGSDNANRLLLHSYLLTFIHPITLDEITIKNYPDWM